MLGGRLSSSPLRGCHESASLNSNLAGGCNMSTITVVGAGIGRQFINGDPNWCEWRVSYEIDGRGLYYHSAETRMTRRTPSNGPSANSVNRISAKGAGPKPRVNGVRNGSAAQESTLC